MRYTRKTTIAAVKDQVSCDLAGEAAILNFKSGSYYGLNPIGARIWNLVQKPTPFGAIIDAITGEYDVPADIFEKDLAELLNKLEAEGLIMAGDEPTS
jgi:hypothetical protein